MHTNLLPPVLLTCTLLASGIAAQQLPGDRTLGAETLTADTLRGFLSVLASDEFEGRGTGQPGYKKAADFVVEHFKSLGLKPGMPDGSFTQAVPWVLIEIDAEKWAFDVSNGSTKASIAMDEVHGTVNGDMEVKGEAVILKGNDAGGVDLTDKVVFVLPDDQPAGQRGGRRGAGRRGGRRGGTASPTAGAAAVFQVNDASFGRTDELIGANFANTTPAQRGAGRRGGLSNQLVISQASLEKVIAVSGKNLAAVTNSGGATPLGCEISFKLDTNEVQAPAHNVVAVLEGSDPQLKNEYVVIGAHLDHLGKRGDVIYNGADDDGSGSAGVMAIAQAFAKNHVVPRRSIMFLAFCGEERGLVGSNWFASNPPIELSQIVVELQVDMIGRDEEEVNRRTGEVVESASDNTNTLHLIGTEKLSTDLHELCLKLNTGRAKFELEWDEEDVYYRSDHFSFAKYGVPIAFFFTGFHRDYHQATDTIEKINFEKLARISKYVYDIGFEIAQADGRPMIEAELWEKMERKGSANPAGPIKK